MKKYPRLVFVFTAILVLVCRCRADPFTPDIVPIAFSDKSFASCEGLTEYLGAGPGSVAQNYVYQCEIPCPDGSVAKFDLSERPARALYDKADFQAKYCKAGSVPSPTATATQTETPIGPAPIPPAAAPLLTGQVTTCDLESRYINFRFVDGAPAVSGDDIVLTMGGTPLKCTVPPSNKTILSCLLPPGVEFPTDVKVAIGDSIANQFSYNGDECYYVEPSRTPPPEAPAATPTPTL